MMKVFKFLMMIFCVFLVGCASRGRDNQYRDAQMIPPLKTPSGYIKSSDIHYPIPAANVSKNAQSVDLLPPGIQVQGK